MKQRGYYSTMLDLDGLDPELKVDRDWEDRESQPALLRWLFRNDRLDVVRWLVARGVFHSVLEEKVSLATDAKDQLYRSLPAEPAVPKENLSPRALAKLELRKWNGLPWRRIERDLAVETAVRRDWIRRRVDANDPAKVLRFYRVTASYILELMAANNLVETLYGYAVTLEKMDRLGVRGFVDYGAGVGTLGILAAERGMDVTHLDLPSPTLDFARWRYETRGLSVRMAECSGMHDDIPAARVVVCTELVEHVSQPLVLLDALAHAVPVGGFLIVSESCLETDKFISHLPSNRWLGGRRFDYELERRGFGEVLSEPAVHPRVFEKRELAVCFR